LSQLEKDEHPLDANTTTGYHSGLLLGPFYRLEGNDEKARPFFKERLDLAMSLLEDDDLANNFQA